MNQGVALYIINFVRNCISSARSVVSHQAAGNTRWRVMRYKGGSPPLMICTALRAAMICQACGLDKKILVPKNEDFLAHTYKIDPNRKFFRNRSVFFGQRIDLSLGGDELRKSPQRRVPNYSGKRSYVRITCRYLQVCSS